MIPDRPHIALTAVYIEDTEQLFDEGLRSRPGIHFRWSFRQDLGFPPGGFVLQLNPANYPNPPIEGSFAHVQLPRNTNEALNRIVEDLDPISAARERYSASAGELIESIRALTDPASDEPMHRRPIPGTPPVDEPTTVQLYALDMLLAASVDPFVARMLGLYWILEIPEDPIRNYVEFFVEIAQYRVVGDWADQEWPLHEVDLKAVPPREAMEGEVEADGVRLYAFGRNLASVSGADDDLYGPCLRLRSTDSSPPLRLVFPAPVGEVRLRVKVSGTDAPWRADAIDDGGHHQPVSLLPGDDSLTIRRRDGGKFLRLDLSGAGDTWYLYEIAYREGVGPIGEIASEYIGAARTRPTVPKITTLATTTAPATLGHDGAVAAHRSHVEVSCGAAASPLEPARPVRLHVGRSPGAHLGEPTEVVTRSHPAVTPAIFQPAAAKAILPELLADWSFAGHTRDSKSGREARLRGAGGFARRHPRSLGRRSLSLRAAGFVEAQNRRELESIGSRVSFDAWVLPRRTSENATIIGTGRDRGVWLGLGPEGEEERRVEFRLNGHAFESARTVPVRRWTRVTAVYDGSRVTLYLNGEEDSAHDATLGPVDSTPESSLCIGADSGSTVATLRNPFSGELADVRIWKDALHPTDADERLDYVRSELNSRVETSDLLAAWPGPLEFQIHTAPIEARDRPELSAIGQELMLEAWVNPVRGQDSPVIIGNGRTSFSLGLRQVGDAMYRAVLWLKAPPRPPGENEDPDLEWFGAFHSSRTVPADAWSHLTVSYDGRQVRFFVNGGLDSTHPANLGVVWDNPEGVLVIGAEASTRPGEFRHAFRGMLTEVRIWRRALAPQDVERRVTRTQFIDRDLPDGDYAYRIQGIDLFGRVSDWSEPQTVTVRDTTPPPPPVNVQARYVPLTGSIVGVVEGKTFRTDIDVPDTFEGSDLHGYDAVIERVSENGPTGRYRQSFEIVGAEIDTGRLRLTLRTPPFSQLRPEEGDGITIDFDWRIEVTWGFTGRQRLFFPRAAAFRVFRQRGPLNTLRGSVRDVSSIGRDRFSVATTLTLPSRADVLADTPCQVGAHRYTLAGHNSGTNGTLQLHYAASPVIAPKVGDVVQVPLPPGAPLYADFSQPGAWRTDEATVPLNPSPVFDSDVSAETADVADEERDALRETGVTWLPDSGLKRITLRNPSGVPGTPPASEFVAGVLVARTPENVDNPWLALTVVWHELADGNLVVYAVSDDGESVPSELLDVRYHPGERYQLVLEATDTLDFAAGQATIQHAVGLTTVDEGGNQSGVSAPATVVAVDRRRPPTPSRPPVIERIDRADYYGQSRVSIRWEAAGDSTPQPVSYLLYRSIDSAIFNRDLEQRRLRTGYYRGLSPEEIMQGRGIEATGPDDIDFADWLPVISRSLGQIDLEANWTTSLFEPRPTGMRPMDADDPAARAWEAWDAATPVWRAWADRFYPALTNEEIADLAERRGNETAFVVVNEHPLEGNRYTDSVNGLVGNRYLYRLRTRSTALALSTEWGPVSDPAAAPAAPPLQAPTVVGIEGGDRSVTLRWSPNRERNLWGYRIYRSRDPGDLDDLRWWHPARPDERIAGRRPDPRLLTDGNSLQIPRDTSASETAEHGSLPGTLEVLGVYRLDDFDPERPSESLPAALNYYNPAAPTHSEVARDADRLVIRSLRRIPDGTAVALIYGDETGDVHVLSQLREGPALIDTSLFGLTDYYYRVVAVGKHGGVSPPSSIVRARTMEIKPPPPPELTLIRDSETETSDLVKIECVSEPNLEVLIEARGLDERNWRTVFAWQETADTLRLTDRVRAWEAVYYRAWSRTPANTMCEPPPEHPTAGRGEGAS